MFNCVLYQPEIPPNTGNIIRLCANTGVKLHLIHPLGFKLDDRKLKRAGLDYHEWATVQEYDSLTNFIQTIQPKRIFACSTKGDTNYSTPNYQTGDTFLFGPETRGLPQHVLDSIETVIRIPMYTNSRSLNLSNSAAIIIYEAWRQLDFK
ncbi:MAG: tRNA (uridine(34)/cytosine(34)/5-carboxymethylaminomethyluridine(34)-2'-O)-methyltransferase TrmL [Proteobacteria bacterium]|nr:tRNA (uridine(34)/cytosine(34)/5-carboxymethylaminomethyluridine(34)-2'-O)-methyltransferase TrmL [Pseudomonadota bacterium]